MGRLSTFHRLKRLRQLRPPSTFLWWRLSSVPVVALSSRSNGDIYSPSPILLYQLPAYMILIRLSDLVRFYLNRGEIMKLRSIKVRTYWDKALKTLCENEKIGLQSSTSSMSYPGTLRQSNLDAAPHRYARDDDKGYLYIFLHVFQSRFFQTGDWA